jgi:hypothetical protein
MASIDITHSDYDNCYKRWKMAYDFYRGGRYVLQPDWAASTHHWVVERHYTSIDDNGANGDERNQSSYEWIPASSNSYLFKHPSERFEEYNERQARAVHYPYFSQYVDIYVSGIFKLGQSRENVGTLYKDYLDDVDLRGNTIDIFMRNMLSAAIVFGRCHAVTDMPSYDGQLTSLAEQRAAGLRAYSRMVTPLDLVDWDMDDRGNFIWVKIKEPMHQARSYEDNQPEQAYQYRVLTKDAWYVYGLANQKNYLISGGEYPEQLKGQVPIATLWAGKERSMSCESPIASIVDGDRHIYNKRSELDTIERLNGFSMLCVPNMEGMPVGPIDIGPGRALSYPAQAGSPSWLSSDPGIIAGLADRITTDAHELRVLAGVSRGAAEGSKELRSAAALSEESEVRTNQMSIWSASAQECEKTMLYHVAGWEGVSDALIPSVSYQVDFNRRAVANQINDLVQLNSTSAINAEVRVEIAKPIVYRVLKENGIEESKILEIVNMMVPEIEPILEINNEIKTGEENL